MKDGMLGVLVSAYKEVIWPILKATNYRRKVTKERTTENSLSVLHGRSERSYMQVAYSVADMFRLV
jgi:hypothetical protein